jgi:Rrf2 family transcriptional regulator, cysteine metabolism repressor
MNFTAKEDYGIKAVLDIAMNRHKVPIQAREIAERQHIPEQFLEQVLAALRRGGIVRSIRGAYGGYDLARDAGRITMGDILKALSGPLVPTQYAAEGEQVVCSGQESCSVAYFWAQVRDAIAQVVDGTTVQDLVDQQLKHLQSESFMMNI